MGWVFVVLKYFGLFALQILVWIACGAVLIAGILLWAFVRNRIWPPPPVEQAKIAAVRRELRSLQTYCWYLEKTNKPESSSLGGVPQLRAGSAWPRSDNGSLSFLAQIDLAALKARDGPAWLPESGLLLFFADVEAGEWAVVQGDASAPGAAEPTDLPIERKKVLRYPRQAVRFRRARSWPGFGRLKTRSTGDEEKAARESLNIAEPPERAHQLGGFPRCVQGDDMEWECEIAARKISVKRFGEWLESAEAATLEADVRTWKLLLQIDSDNDLGFSWVDGGTLYFWVREQAARAGDFSQVQMIVQFT